MADNDDPFADLPAAPLEAPANVRQFAQAQWEIFEALRAVGFYRQEAIQLTSTFLGATVMMPPMPDGEG